MMKYPMVGFWIGFLGIFAPGTYIMYAVYLPMPVCNVFYCVLPLLTTSIIVLLFGWLWYRKGVRSLYDLVYRDPTTAGALLALVFVVLQLYLLDAKAHIYYTQTWDMIQSYNYSAPAQYIDTHFNFTLPPINGG